MGRRHIQVSRKLCLELTGVYDVNADALQLAHNENHLVSNQLFNDPEKLFRTHPECVIIATTADSHCRLTCEAAEHGAKFILVEKPMAVSLEECDRMMKCCARYGAQLAVNHQMRFMEQYVLPKQLFATAAYGGLTSMTVLGGNMGIAMNGTHYFEAFRFLTDEIPAEITAWFSLQVVANPRGPQFEDRAGSIRVVTASGKRLYMEIGTDQGHGVRVVYAGRNGMITVNELSGEMLLSERRPEFRDLPTSRYGMPANDSTRLIQPAEVIDTSAAVLNALLTNKNSVSGEDGRRAVAVLVAAYQSAESGSVPVKIDTTLNKMRVFPWA